MSHRQGTAFVTSRKGFYCLTIKIARRNDDIMKIRHGTLFCYVSPITPLAGYAARISPGALRMPCFHPVVSHWVSLTA